MICLTFKLISCLVNVTNDCATAERADILRIWCPLLVGVGSWM